MTDFRMNIEGYAEIARDLQVCRKYGIDYRATAGMFGDVVQRLHPRELRLKVSEIIDITPSTRTLRLVPCEGILPPFLAGQYISVIVDVDHIRTSRPYSISSPPNQTGYYDITIKKAAGGLVSNYLLDQVKIGDVIQASGPAGNFYYNPLIHGHELVFIAGGIGITPFMSMIREATDCGYERKMHLIYGCQTPEDVPFLDELRERAGRHPNLRVDLVISDPPPGYQGPSGLIDGRIIKELVGSPEGRTFYVCGPTAMYDLVIPELAALGVPRRRLRHEVIGAPADVTKVPGWPAEIDKNDQFRVQLASGQSITARAGETLLTALERNGLAVPSSCRSGACSLCRVKVLEGKVFEPEGALVRKSDRQFGYVHSCVSYPLTDLKVAW